MHGMQRRLLFGAFAQRVFQIQTCSEISVCLANAVLRAHERALFAFAQKPVVRAVLPTAVTQYMHLTDRAVRGNFPTRNAQKSARLRGGALFFQPFETVVIGHGNERNARLFGAGGDSRGRIFSVGITGMQMQIGSHDESYFMIFPS